MVVPQDLVSFSEIMRVFVPALIKSQTTKRGTDSCSIIRGRIRDKGEGKDYWIRIGSKYPYLLQVSKTH